MAEVSGNSRGKLMAEDHETKNAMGRVDRLGRPLNDVERCRCSYGVESKTVLLYRAAPLLAMPYGHTR